MSLYCICARTTLRKQHACLALAEILFLATCGHHATIRPQKPLDSIQGLFFYLGIYNIVKAWHLSARLHIVG